MMTLIRRAAETLGKRFTAKGMILMYHRVAEADLDPWGMNVSPGNFAEQLEVIQRDFQPLGLQTLVQKQRERKVPDRSIIITFDDGYADNLHTAGPLLERYEVPATIFLITDGINGGRHFWWDRLEWALLEPETLPEKLQLEIGGGTCEWLLGDAYRYNLENRREDRGRRPWDALPGTRLAFFYSVWQRLVPISKAERREAMEAISTWAGINAGISRRDRAFTADELRALAGSRLVEIGAHTVSHPSLPALSSENQLEEIQDSKLQLEQITGRPVTSFSYPHGDYTVETAALVQKAGFRCACTTKFEPVFSATDPYQLPRFQVENWNGEEFSRRLARFYMM